MDIGWEINLSERKNCKSIPFSCSVAVQINTELDHFYTFIYSKVKNIFSAFVQQIAFGIVVSFKRHQDLIFSSKLTENVGSTLNIGRPIQHGRQGSVALIKSARK